MKRLIAITLGVALAGLGTVTFAARNSSGTYSRPAGNPVTTLTPITSTWANTLTSDIATELTDSLSRSGKGGMLAPLRTTNGSAALPSLSFTNSTNTGFYLLGVGDVGLSLSGTKYVEWSAYVTTVSTDAVFLGSVTSMVAPVYATTIGTRASVDVDLIASSTAMITLKAAGTIDVHGKTVQNVGTPVASTDAATKGYVDGLEAVLVTTTDQVESAASYTNVSGLTFSAEANKTYMFDAIVVTSSSATTNGVWLAFNGPAAPTSLNYTFIWHNDNTYPTSATMVDSDSYDATTGYPVNSPALRSVARLYGVFRNGANAGTFALRMRTEAAAGASVWVMTGSTLRYRKIN